VSVREGVTLVIPTIPPRTNLLHRAITSACQQARPFSDIHIAVDLDREGAGVVRTRGMRTVQTRWTAFLDDDDELLPQHLDVLIRNAEATGADVVFPWFTVAGGTDPFPQFFGKPFDPELPHMFPITVLARTELINATAGFREDPEYTDGNGEDWIMWLELVQMGAKIVHVPERTWIWHHDSGNTSGLPTRW